MKSEVTIQYSEKNITEADLYTQAKQAYMEAGNKASTIKTLKLYIQPENQITYFVVNDDFEGSFAI